MKIYIASNFESRDRIRPIRDRVWAMGHEVTSSWLDEVVRPASLSQEEFYRRLAIKDLCEISAAELVIVDTIEVTPRGGRENEYGFALGRYQKCLIWIVGPARSVFHQLADNRFDNWDEALSFLQFGYEDRANRESNDPSNLAQSTDGSQAWLGPEIRWGENSLRPTPSIRDRVPGEDIHHGGEEVLREQLPPGNQLVSNSRSGNAASGIVEERRRH